MTSLLQRTKSRPDRYRDLAWRVLAGLFVVALVGTLLWSMGAERRAILRMDPVERRAVYEQAFGELQRLCGSGPRDDALEKRCTEQIRFVTQFPECDAPCQELARSHTPLPTK
jgi:cytochrome b pre-mRNA-processing protein 3